MNAETLARLLDLNKQFYQTFGQEFSSTRHRLQPGVMRVLAMLGGDEALLDLGCGNGQLARELLRRGHQGCYTGIDLSIPLLESAHQVGESSSIIFLHADLAGVDWDSPLNLPGGQPYNLVTAFAVLHHLPGESLRLTLLHKVHRLLHPGGLFIHSEWQFLKSSRLRSRIQSWSGIGLAEADVDPGDYLLDWRHGGIGLRYLHHFNEEELDILAKESHFRICNTFSSDGENGQLGLYQVWEAV